MAAAYPAVGRLEPRPAGWRVSFVLFAALRLDVRAENPEMSLPLLETRRDLPLEYSAVGAVAQPEHDEAMFRTRISRTTLSKSDSRLVSLTCATRCSFRSGERWKNKCMDDGLPDQLLVVARELAGLHYRRRLLLAQRTANSARMQAELDDRVAECEERLRRIGRSLSDSTREEV
jgi:hypothetical protein